MSYGRVNRVISYHIVSYCIITVSILRISENVSRLNSNIIKHMLKYNSHTLAHYCDNMQYTDGQVSTPPLTVCHFSVDSLQVPKLIYNNKKFSQS